MIKIDGDKLAELLKSNKYKWDVVSNKEDAVNPKDYDTLIAEAKAKIAIKSYDLIVATFSCHGQTGGEFKTDRLIFSNSKFRTRLNIESEINSLTYNQRSDKHVPTIFAFDCCRKPGLYNNLRSSKNKDKGGVCSAIVVAEQYKKNQA